MNKNKYWDFFYKKQVNKINLNYPSQFATFTVGETENVTTLLEFGCGNGRDALFFRHHFRKVYAFDGSNEVINKNKKLYSKIKNLKFSKFNLNNEFNNYHILSCKKKTIYARFFLHALTNIEIKSFISLCSDLLNKDERLYIEYRTEKDKKRNKETQKHYRNYINPNLINKLLKKFNLKNVYFVKGLGFAKYKNDDAFVARHIIEKLDVQKKN
jgi:cyclopropane fatty-acyl-phospholipid synthase-like methyltransferase